MVSISFPLSCKIPSFVTSKAAHPCIPFQFASFRNSSRDLDLHFVFPRSWRQNSTLNALLCFREQSRQSRLQRNRNRYYSMMVVVIMRTVPVAMFTRAGFAAGMVIGSYTPESVTAPCAFLTLFTAVLGSSTASTLSELACVLFPLPALPVRALPDTAAAIILSAEVAHNNTCPVLHVPLLG